MRCEIPTPQATSAQRPSMAACRHQPEGANVGLGTHCPLLLLPPTRSHSPSFSGSPGYGLATMTWNIPKP